ncbi:hypothetical protein PQI66_04215 [Corynebacterium sp. USCH3]|uniref:hypothetical protein n=1 Tax=Corynebacterium sp. USCH3 TaxID=3024840 RepID=UPI003097765C
MQRQTSSAHAGVHDRREGGASRPGTTEVVSLLTVAGDSALECVRRSTVFRRMAGGTLPFAGRAAYLEQHWEGLRILRSALATPGLDIDPAAAASLLSALAAATDQFSGALDRAHATARWRERHVTMPSMLQFRRHIAELQDKGDTVGLVAHTYLRLLVSRACPAPAAQGGEPRALYGAVAAVVQDEETLEQLSEELSVALLLLMQHGADVCRGYHERDADSGCAVTVSTIRRALR